MEYIKKVDLLAAAVEVEYLGRPRMMVSAAKIGMMPAVEVPDRPQGEWIPCEERLPSKNGKYLIVGRQGAVNILPYRDGRWYGRWGVLAWMPLPKPWKGADDETD